MAVIALGAGGLLVGTADPAFAYNPCNGPTPPARCDPPEKAPPVPAAPTALAATGTTTTAVLTWNDNATTEAGFAILRQPGTESPFSRTEATLVAYIPAHPGTGSMTYTDQGLDPSSDYTYEVEAYSVLYALPGQGNTFGAESSFSLPVAFPAPPTPPTFEITTTSTVYGNPAVLTWAATSPSVIGFHLYGFYANGEPDLLQTLNANTTSAALPYNTNEAGQQACFFVNAFNAAGPNSWEGSRVCVTYPPTPPTAPNVTNLRGSVARQGLLSQMTWTWDQVSGDTYQVVITNKTTGQALESGVNSSGTESYTISYGAAQVIELRIVTRQPGYLESTGETNDLPVITPPTAPNPTGLTGVVGTTENPIVEWHWDDVPGDTYRATITDTTTGVMIHSGIISSPFPGFGYEDSSRPGDVYEIRVVAHEPGYLDSPGVTSELTAPGLLPVVVPGVVNEAFATAVAALQARGLKVSGTSNYGQVISENPPAGRSVPRGTTVTLTLRQGVSSVSFTYNSSDTGDNAEEFLYDNTNGACADVETLAYGNSYYLKFLLNFHYYSIYVYDSDTGASCSDLPADYLWYSGPNPIFGETDGPAGPNIGSF